MLDLLKRSAETAVKLPFAVAWDFISLGNMGEGTSTGKVLAEHQQQKKIDELKEAVKHIKAMDGKE